jgi:hypothetical protein
MDGNGGAANATDGYAFNGANKTLTATVTDARRYHFADDTTANVTGILQSREGAAAAGIPTTAGIWGTTVSTTTFQEYVYSSDTSANNASIGGASYRLGASGSDGVTGFLFGGRLGSGPTTAVRKHNFTTVSNTNGTSLAVSRQWGGAVGDSTRSVISGGSTASFVLLTTYVEYVHASDTTGNLSPTLSSGLQGRTGMSNCHAGL